MDTHQLNSALMRRDWPVAAALLAPHTKDPKAHPSLVYNYAKVLVELGRLQDAMPLFQRCVAQAPDHASAWFEMGRTALALEQFEIGYDAFSKAASLDPKDVDATRNLARVALRLGHWQVALSSWTLLKGDDEADLALYRIAAETQDPKTAEIRATLLQDHPNRAAVIRTLVRVSKGAIPLNL